MTRFVLLFAALVLPALASAQEPDQGQMLYENHCGACHESTVHVREQARAATLADVRAYVQRWSDYLDLGWGDDERDAVIEYLNLTYYGYFDEEVPPPPTSK